MKMKEISAERFKSRGFVAVGRHFRDHYINKELTFLEYHLLMWLMMSATPKTGSVSTSYAALEADFGGKYNKNSINKVMLSLKRKRYIWFRDHAGSRASFNVYIGSFLLRSGNLSDISDYFESRKSRGETLLGKSMSKEVREELLPVKKRSGQLEKTVAKANRVTTLSSEGRGCDYKNENDNENNNKNRGFPKSIRRDLEEKGVIKPRR